MTKIFDTATVISLPNGEAELSFYAQSGGVLNHLLLSAGDKKMNVIAGLDSLEAINANPGYRGVALFPFPNRLQGGSYSFEGKEYQFPINEGWAKNNLHGFLKELSPKVSVSSEPGNTAVISEYIYKGEREYYPFPATVKVEYTLLNAAELEVNVSVTNTGEGSMPVGIGWHPYFELGSSIDKLLMKMPPSARVLIDERMIPTGETAKFDGFETFAKLGDIKLDDCFVPAQGGVEEVSVKLWSDYAACGLEVWQDKNYGFVQLYTPPDRQSIAIEPMSCNINAFQSGDGLTVLAAGESFNGKFGVRLFTDKLLTNS